MQWPTKPIIYQINTWVWLNSLSRTHNERITLGNLPEAELDRIAALGVHAVWLMGIWQRSATGRMMAQQYQHEYVTALPDITPDDIVGSPYAIYDYTVDDHLGDREQLAHLRQRLQARGLRLLLDFVPNHVALDHRWVREHPEYMMQGTVADLEARPSDFYRAQDTNGQDLIIAHGRDPYFPGWSDTAQLNAFSPDLRAAMLATLLDIASQCDGVRCDMAMLLNTDIFNRTWSAWLHHAPTPETEYWHALIPPVKAQHPDFCFIAEVYWNMEATMQALGFDLTYDKLLYDRMLTYTPSDVRIHLISEMNYQRRLVRFIENHDEPRAYTTFGPGKSLSAATLAATLPGALLLHEGQLTGRKAKLPVQIARQPDEPVDEALYSFYQRLLNELRNSVYQQGTWRLLTMFPAWSENESYNNLIAHGWQDETTLRLIVVNLTDAPAQALVNLGPWHQKLGDRQWLLYDVLNDASYTQDGNRMLQSGLYVDLQAYQSHLFTFKPCP